MGNDKQQVTVSSSLLIRSLWTVFFIWRVDCFKSEKVITGPSSSAVQEILGITLSSLLYSQLTHCSL
ncbi:hypothetical protein MANES_13G093508v8 [Manihot esculenta]|uniref:Uncharacterized protein n=1 Tax=Manihot esculenta TaxID=3983 RepID=A0ACB7GMR0_MANES|nr:hypothetical protein MANES_13G093508v8 [Manihot esculenta]